MQENLGNNRTEEIGSVTPTPGNARHGVTLVIIVENGMFLLHSIDRGQ